MSIEGAVIKEQGVTFAVVVVKSSVVQSQATASRTSASLSPSFGGIPVVLMAQDCRGKPTYWGRRDLARFLANLPIAAIPWRRYDLR
ncbi:MAG: hypothetical protein R3C68_06340 [Myxococcota bacterium]